MYSYPQYIYPPTTVPVQRYFANPYVRTNEYDLGGIIGGIGDKLGGVFGSKGSSLMGGLGKIGIGGGMLSGIGSAVGNIGGKAISGGLSSGAGKAISGIGNAVGGVVGKFNPLLGAAVSAASGILGGLTNRAFGSKLNDAAISAIDSDINSLNSTRVTDSDNASIANQATAQNWGSAFDKSTVGKDGWFANKAQKEFERLQRGMVSSQNYVAANYDNAATNVTKNMMNNLLMNSAAYGGFFDNPFSHPGSGAIAYGLEQQNLANQQQLLGQMQAQQQQPQVPFNAGGNTFGCGGNKYCLGGRFFADGGMVNSHGSDFTNGLMYIENGGTHEENPYQGVPMGYDSQGVPNVVEEDEVVAPKRLLGDGGQSDYVFSNRINITDEFAEKYHLPYDISVAEAVKILTKESKETPNDIIHENTNKVILTEARDMQEQIKAQQEQEQQMAMQQAFAQMPPEEQEMIAQQMMQQEGQEPGMEEMMSQEGMEQNPETFQPSMGAFGGNLYGTGGGFFSPVHLHADDGPLEAYVPPAAEVVEKPAGRQFKDNFDATWRALMAPRIREWITNNFYTKDPETGQLIARQSEADRMKALNLLNSLQEAYGAAGMRNDPLEKIRKSPEILALQKAANAMGINDVFTDEAMDKWFKDYQNQTGDVSPTYLDGQNGGWTKTRMAGYNGLVDPETVELLRRAGVAFTPEPDNSSMYIAKNMANWAPDQEYTYGADPNSDGSYVNTDYRWDDNGNYIGPELQPHEYLTEDELEGVVRDLDERNGAPRDLLPTWQRNVPLWMSGLASLTDALGLTNKPDYSGARMLEALADRNSGFMPVSYKPVGQYMRPVLFDPYQAMIAANANAAATRRGIQDNSNGNAAMANASLVGVDRNAGLALGNLGETGQKFNADQYRSMLDFNRGTDAQNSQLGLSASAQNAQDWRYGLGAHASLMGQALEYRQREKQLADAARAANLSNFVKGMSNYGKENAYINMINTNPANGGYGYRDRRFGVYYDSPFFRLPV